jgi:hypothetical protein
MSEGGTRRTGETMILSAFRNFRSPLGQRMIYRVRDFDIAQGNRVFHVKAARSLEKLDEEIREIFWVVVSSLILVTLVLIA